MLKTCSYKCGFETEEDDGLRAHHTEHWFKLQQKSMSDALSAAMQEHHQAGETKETALRLAMAAASAKLTPDEMIDLYRQILAKLMGAGL